VSCCAVNFTEKYNEGVKLYMGSDNGQIFMNIIEKGKRFDDISKNIHTI